MANLRAHKPLQLSVTRTLAILFLSFVCLSYGVEAKRLNEKQAGASSLTNAWFKVLS